MEFKRTLFFYLVIFTGILFHHQAFCENNHEGINENSENRNTYTTESMSNAIETIAPSAKPVASEEQTPTHLDEHEKYIQDFIKSLPKSAREFVYYKNGELIIENAPWDSTLYKKYIKTTAIGAILLWLNTFFGFFYNMDPSFISIPLLIGIVLLIREIKAAIKNANPGECILCFNNKGILLDGDSCVKWENIDKLAIDTVTLCNEYGIESEKKNIKISDQFDNELFQFSSKRKMAVSFDSLVTLIKHYLQWVTKKQIIPTEKQTTIGTQKPEVRYVTVYR